MVGSCYDCATIFKNDFHKIIMNRTGQLFNHRWLKKIVFEVITQNFITHRKPFNIPGLTICQGYFRAPCQTMNIQAVKANFRDYNIIVFKAFVNISNFKFYFPAILLF